MSEKNAIIQYNGSQINLFSDDRADYINITDIATAYKGKGKATPALLLWIRNLQTLKFLNAWEAKNNTKYDPSKLDEAIKSAKAKTLSVKKWSDITGAIGVFSRSMGTYAHKDIAIRFAGWLSPEFELYLVEEIQSLKDLERKLTSYDYLNREQILYLITLKEVFKYVAHQVTIENAHKEVFASRSGSTNPFAEFHKWRNEILEISPAIIDERIQEYCIKNNIPVNKRIMKKPKREKILLLDSYDSVKIAVWDFLSIKGEVNALKFASLVSDIIRTEKGEVLRENEDTLFHSKAELGEFKDFEKKVAEMKEVKTARQLLEYREKLKAKPIPMTESDIKKIESDFDTQLQGLLAVPSSKKK